MKTPRVLLIFCCGAALVLAAEPTTLPAATTHKKSAPQKQDDENSDASSSPSPSPAAKRTSRNKKQSAATDSSETPKEKAADDPTPSPTLKESANKEDASSRNKKGSTADEASTGTTSDASSANKAPGPATTSSIEPREIQDFDSQPEPIRKLLTAALDLTKRNLTYSYGSADPATGGLDCSGTIYYLLKAQGFNAVPRQANEQYEWVRKQARFYAVLSKKQDNAELTEMRPGDLLFWTGTYNIDRDPPVTHAMIYLGKRKKDGKRLMMGASDGRPYDGQRRNGVSVFDFKLPAAKSGDHADAATAAAPDHSPDFAGYGPVPGMAERVDAANRQNNTLSGSASKRSDH